MTMELRKMGVRFILFILLVIATCKSQNAAIQQLNVRINRLNRITNGLQRDVDDIWITLANTAVNSGNLQQQCNETDQNQEKSEYMFKLVNNTLSDIKELKTEVDGLVLYAKRGLKTEKALNRKVLNEMLTSLNEVKTRTSNENSEIKKRQEEFEEKWQQALKETLEVFMSNTEKENRLFQQKINNITYEYKDKLEETQMKAQEYYYKTERIEENANELEKHVAHLTDELDVVKSVMNEKFQCNEGWENFGTHCYFFSSVKKTWDEAWNFCKSKNSHIVELNNETQIAFLVQKCSTQYSVWAGANDKETEGKFIWQNNRQPVSGYFFYPSEPNGGINENCAELYCQSDRTGKLNDCQCGSKRCFFCETDANFV